MLRTPKTFLAVTELLFSVFLLGCNFDNNEETLSEKTEKEPVTIVIKNQPVTTVVKKSTSTELKFEAETDGGNLTYQWYESADGTTNTGTTIENENQNTYIVSPFTERGIRYFYCVAGAESETVTSSIAAVAYTELPLVEITTVDGMKPTSAKEKHEGRLQIYYPNGDKYDSGESNDFSIKVRGNATAGYPKAPYKLKLPKKKNLIDINSEENKDKNWVLLASYCDKTLLRNKIGFYTAELFNEIDGNEKLYVPHSIFVDVILNGEYIGNYTLVDSVKEGTERCSVNEKDSDDNGIGFVAEYDPGYYDREPKWFKTSLKEYPYTFKFPDTDEADFDTYMQRFESYMNEFETALYNNDSDDWQDYIDLESFARWFLIHNILANIDTNYFFTKKSSENSKLVMEPVWDFEWSIGIGWYYGERPRPANYWCVNGWYFSELLQKDEFKSELKNLFLYTGDFAKKITSKMDEFSEEIAVSQKVNFIRWPILNSQVSVGGIPLGSYEAELDCDKEFICNRFAWLETAINEL